MTDQTEEQPAEERTLEIRMDDLRRAQITPEMAEELTWKTIRRYLDASSEWCRWERHDEWTCGDVAIKPRYGTKLSEKAKKKKIEKIARAEGRGEAGVWDDMIQADPLGRSHMDFVGENQPRAYFMMELGWEHEEGSSWTHTTGVTVEDDANKRWIIQRIAEAKGITDEEAWRGVVQSPPERPPVEFQGEETNG